MVQAPAWYVPNPGLAGEVAFILFTGSEPDNPQPRRVTNGRFAINDVSLTAGTNTITAVATAPTGQSAMTAVDLTAAGTPAVLTLKADRTTGIVPFTVTFTYEFSSTLPINKLMMDFDGDGRDDLRTVKAPTSVQNTYTRADLYNATEPGPVE